MKPLRTAGLSLLFALAACGHAGGVAGNWNLESPKGGKIEHIEFDSGSTRAQVAIDRDGEHVHLEFQDVLAANEVTLTGSWDGKAATWKGKLAGDHLELAGPDGAMTFHRGAGH